MFYGDYIKVLRLRLNDYSFSSSSEDESVTDDDGFHLIDCSMTGSKISESQPVTFKSLFPTMEEVYGTKLIEPKKEDLMTYKRYLLYYMRERNKLLVIYDFSYVLIGRKANGTGTKNFTPVSFNLKPCQLSKDSSLSVTPPKVTSKSIDIYERYIATGFNGGFTPKLSDLELYKKYTMYK